ncbi:MAG: ABC transporter ATP-binding protein/permease [Acidobacteriia bacterium]|nr:ABC transporter ATP-binding protein/permease [Terriglobia bacterium]
MENTRKNQDGQRNLPRMEEFALILPFLRPYALRLSFVFFLTLAASLAGLAYPLGVKFLVEALTGRNERLLILTALAMAALVLAGFALGALTRYLYMQVSSRILMDMRVSLFRHLQTLSPRFFAGTKTGEIVSRLGSDVAEIQSVGTDALLSLVLSLLTLLGTLAALIWLDWKLFLLCTFFLPASAFFLARFRKRVAEKAREVRERNAELSSTLLESLLGMKWIQGIRAEETEARKLEAGNERYISALLGYQRASSWAGASPAVLLAASTLALLLFGGHRVIAAEISLASLAAFAAYQARALGPVQNLVGLFLSVQRARVALSRVLEFLALQPEVREKPDAAALSAPRGEVELRNVSFSYVAGVPVIERLSLRIPPGGRIGIVGPSGAGKSTLVDLLLRFYDPQEGSLLLDGCDLRDLQMNSLRGALTVVSAEPFLFHASIEENLRYVRPDATLAQLNGALRMADLAEFVEALPDGLATVAGERGVRLSTGQRQRLALARAVLRDAPVWIFDEATGSLDVLSESRIWAGLGQWLSGRTTLIISHRLSSVRDADQIIVLDRGKLAQQGSHDRLLEEDGLYQRLHRAAVREQSLPVGAFRP